MKDVPEPNIPLLGGRAEHDDSPSGGPVAVAVVEATAAATGIGPLELDPLGTAIDPEALNRVIRSTGPESSISFAYHGCDVTVRGDGSLDVTTR